MFGTLCQICKTRPATIHLTAIDTDGSVVELHISSMAARQLGLDLHGDPPSCEQIRDIQRQGEDALLGDEDGEISSIKAPTLTAATGATTLSCPDCGLIYSAFAENNRFGCASCYAAFAENLDPALADIHGSNRHVGRVPALNANDAERQVRRRAHLEDRLAQAVEDENYEEAARIRDLLKGDGT
ncbi:MAG: UvrB/UvrC motif-containing protein [Planctomycetota bacterium]|jgi:protein arginine kinase activator|nr:UvrB/UvrC motif-containing protein [Planctomycetota bacterium]